MGLIPLYTVYEALKSEPKLPKHAWSLKSWQWYNFSRSLKWRDESFRNALAGIAKQEKPIRRRTQSINGGEEQLESDDKVGWQSQRHGVLARLLRV